MFTGIVEQQGLVQQVIKRNNLIELVIYAPDTKGIKNGDSVAVDGVCLTATHKKNKILKFDVMKETIFATTLKNIRFNQKVNLEKTLTMGSPFGGHFVTGHVDGVGVIKEKIKKENYLEYKIAIDPKLSRFIVVKGSICVDGISLTVGKAHKGIFSVYLIPYTIQHTTLGKKKTEDLVNVETDILAKYVLGFKKN